MLTLLLICLTFVATLGCKAPRKVGGRETIAQYPGYGRCRQRDMRQRANCYGNVARRWYCKGALQWHSKISQLCQQHSQYMANRNKISHDGFSNRVSQFGFRTAAAENVAMNHHGSNTAQAAIEQWLNSSGHRKNLLNSNFNRVGYGMVQKGTKKFWCQMFGKQ